VFLTQWLCLVFPTFSSGKVASMKASTLNNNESNAKKRPSLRQLNIGAYAESTPNAPSSTQDSSRANQATRATASLRPLRPQWEDKAQAWAQPHAQAILNPQLAIDALQTAVLCEIFSKNAERFILKGGLAMRVNVGARRHTKDIDLDGDHDCPLDVMIDGLRRSLNSCGKKGLLEDFHHSEPKLTDTTLRFKVDGRLPESQSIVHLTIEISRRRFMPEQAEQVHLSPRFDGEPTGIRVYRKETLMGLKASAFTDENRCAARDLMDLALLVEAGIEPNLECLSVESADQLRARKALVWPKIDLINWALFQEHVLPHLDSEDRAAWNPERLDEARLAVASTLEEAFEREIARRERLCVISQRAPTAGAGCDFS